MDDTDRAAPTKLLSNNVDHHVTPNAPETRTNVTFNVTRKQLLQSLTGRCLVLKHDAFIPVHLDFNGVADEDISKEVSFTLYEPYFAAKNKRWLNLALMSVDKPRPVLEVKVISNLKPENDLENMYVELFRGTGECQLLKVTFVCPNNEGTWTVSCDGVPMEVSMKVRQLYEELEKSYLEVAERKIMRPTVKY